MDKFLFFCLDQETKKLLEPYQSPRGESSWFKQIPLDLLPKFKSTLKTLGLSYRIVYRGSRRYHQSFTRARDAERFTVYPKG